MKIKIVFGSALFLAAGCFDIFTEKQVELVGHISLISSNKSNDKEYTMVLYKDGINKNVIYENVKDVAGDDSVLLVKSINNECNDVCYKVLHDKGQSLIEVININSKDYCNN